MRESPNATKCKEREANNTSNVISHERQPQGMKVRHCIKISSDACACAMGPDAIYRKPDPFDRKILQRSNHCAPLGRIE